LRADACSGRISRPTSRHGVARRVSLRHKEAGAISSGTRAATRLPPALACIKALIDSPASSRSRPADQPILHLAAAGFGMVLRFMVLDVLRETGEGRHIEARRKENPPREIARSRHTEAERIGLLYNARRAGGESQCRLGTGVERLESDKRRAGVKRRMPKRGNSAPRPRGCRGCGVRKGDRRRSERGCQASGARYDQAVWRSSPRRGAQGVYSCWCEGCQRVVSSAD